MMRKTTAIVLSLAALTAGCAHPTLLRVKVTDTEGAAVPHAQVNVGWSWSYDPSGKTGPKSRNKVGTADASGNYTFFGMTKGGVGVSATGEKHYRTFTNIMTNDPVVVRIRRKQNPIPMHAKKAHADLPSGDGSFGYDLAVGDLVAPFGVGVSTDLVFHVQTTSTNWRDRVLYRLHGDISFPSEGDGIQAFFVPNRVQPQSEYRLPFEAPEDGYSPTLATANEDTEDRYRMFRHGQKDGPSLPDLWYWTEDYQFKDYARSWMEEVNYFVRVRSDPEGHSCFGLIRGIIRFGYRGDDIPYVEFWYYVNPDRTRNIEFDPSRNLITAFGRYRVHEYSPGYP